jgi:hypothetical protein
VGVLIMHADAIPAYLLGTTVFLVGLASLFALERVSLKGGHGGPRA